MGNCYSSDHIAKDHLHIDITRKIEEPQQKYRRLRTASIRILREGLKHVSLNPELSLLATAVVQNI